MVAGRCDCFFLAARSRVTATSTSTLLQMMTSTAPTAVDVAALAQEHARYLTDVAKVQPPARLQALLELVDLRGEDTVIPPTDRKGLNPFLIPIARNKRDGSRLCYIRWPTQKEDMDLQVTMRAPSLKRVPPSSSHPTSPRHTPPTNSLPRPRHTPPAVPDDGRRGGTGGAGHRAGARPVWPLI